MAPRFLAFGWDATEEGRAAARRASQALTEKDDLRRALQLPGLEVWVRAALPLPVHHSPALGVVVIGDLYRRGAITPASGPPSCAQVGETGRAKSLVDTCWGTYVALLQQGAGDWRHVLRDPSGALDTLTWRRDGLRIVASDIQGLPSALTPEHGGLNWDVLSDLLARPESVTWANALHGLSTVAPGDLHDFGGDASEALWRPATWAADVAPSGDEAEARLRNAVELAVGAALQGDGPCLVEVSGGLDSAIVASTAARLDGAARVAGALHLVGDDPESDERRWADIVTRHLGWSTTQLQLTVAEITEADLMEVARGARPTVNAPDLGRDRRTAALAQSLGIKALITGKGGDAAFFQHPTAEILADYVSAHGLQGLAHPLTACLARRLRRSVWSVSWEALRARRRASTEETPSPLLGGRVRTGVECVSHPWLEGLENLPPAKRYQIGGLVRTQVMRGETRFGRVMEVIHPLLSQPVLEASLAIPVWDLARDGRERGLARDAFSDRLPSAIRDRRSKGELSVFFARTVARNLEFLRTWLLDGCLCDAGVLNRRALEAALTPDALMQYGDAPLILRAAAVEAWVRHWQGRVPDWPGAPRRPS